MTDGKLKTVFVTGGAGYVGAALVPALLEAGYGVKVFDLFLYGDDVLDSVKGNPRLEQIKGDIRDRKLLERVIPGCDAVIHLACISNDPSFELDPGLGKSINYDAFIDLVKVSKASGVKRFIYASSSSVYGIKPDQNVTEDLPLEPLTDYSKYKAMCEEVLAKERAPGFTVLTVRPSTVCGYSSRLRLDVVVNILTNNAINSRKIKVFGGEQMRPNLHIDDMVRLYVEALGWPAEKIDGKIYNIGYHNFKVREIAEMVRNVVGPDIEIITTPTDDNRSYHVSSARIQRDLGFSAQRSLEDAVRDLQNAFKANLIPNSMTDDRYYNIKRMQRLKLR
jgi:nucleoside-diphosphate-sugar epimerase